MTMTQFVTSFWLSSRDNIIVLLFGFGILSIVIKDLVYKLRNKHVYRVKK